MTSCVHRHLQLAALGILGTLAGQSDAVAPSLCTAGETVYFSCQARNGKMISLCGKVFEKSRLGRLEEADDPWLQYRFGRPQALELVYPQSKPDSLRRFTPQRIRAQGGAVGIDAIGFVSAGIGYSLEYVVPDGAPAWSGVSVGDPQHFDLERGARPPARYPDARIACAGNDRIRNFTELVDYLDES